MQYLQSSCEQFIKWRSSITYKSEVSHHPSMGNARVPACAYVSGEDSAIKPRPQSPPLPSCLSFGIKIFYPLPALCSRSPPASTVSASDVSRLCRSLSLPSPSLSPKQRLRLPLHRRQTRQPLSSQKPLEYCINSASFPVLLFLQSILFIFFYSWSSFFSSLLLSPSFSSSSFQHKTLGTVHSFVLCP